MKVAVTLIMMVSLAAADGGKGFDWAKRVKVTAWKLDRNANVLDSARNVGAYDVVMIHLGKDGVFGDLAIRIEKDGKAIHTWKGHHETPLRVVGDTLYYSDHSPISSGAAIVAVDLKTGKQIWRTNVKGIGPVSHSKYRNRVSFEVDADVVTVFGEESQGSYVELLDLRSGKTLANDPRKPAP